MSREQADAVALAVDDPRHYKLNSPTQLRLLAEPRKPIPPFMKHARDAYLPLDQRPPPVTLWPYIIATIIAMGCVIFVTAYLWRA